MRKTLVAGALVANLAVAADGAGPLDAAGLAPTAQKELATYLTDELDYCGRPLTVKAALEKGRACGHTARLARYARRLAADGLASVEITNELARHHQSFLGKRASLPVDARMCQGAAEAKVTLVELSDFQCPFCAAARPVLEAFVKGRPDVRLCFLPYPLPQHPHAMTAAQAALFARDAGKFWPMHDGLFEGQDALSEASVRALAAKLGLDTKKLDQALAKGAYVAELEAGKDAAKAAGVAGTPAVFVNGRPHLLGFAPEALAVSVEDELDWLTGERSWKSP